MIEMLVRTGFKMFSIVGEGRKERRKEGREERDC